MPYRWSRMGRALIATAAFSLVFGRALADEAVLVASTVPGYVPGMVVSSTDRLSLPEAASATLLFQSGEMLRLRGPFEGTLGQQTKPNDSSVATLVNLFRMHGIDASVIGGTRSTGAARAAAIDDVQVDASRSATYCVEPSTSVWITHPAGDQHAYAIRRKGSSRTLGWPAGVARLEWPADVPIEDGSRFEIATDGIARATITFRAIPSGGEHAMIVNGILLGCHEQFDNELRRISRSAVRPELWMTSDHGRHPTYHPDEPIMLTVVAATDGYLYCLAARTDGIATPIFPAGAVDGAQLRGSVPLSLPGQRQLIGLRAASGLAKIQCWLADRDITPELPHALFGASSGRPAEQLAGDPDGLFSRIGGTRIETDALSVRIE